LFPFDILFLPHSEQTRSKADVHSVLAVELKRELAVFVCKISALGNYYPYRFSPEASRPWYTVSNVTLNPAVRDAARAELHRDPKTILLFYTKPVSTEEEIRQINL